MIRFSHYESDLSKAFDSIDQQFLIKKLNRYSVDTNSEYFLASHFDKTKQRKKIYGCYNKPDYIFSDVRHKVPCYAHSYLFVIFIISALAPQSFTLH